jgi:AraC family transcriptional regulator, arabinose operon regulatory protein
MRPGFRRPLQTPCKLRLANAADFGAMVVPLARDCFALTGYILPCPLPLFYGFMGQTFVHMSYMREPFDNIRLHSVPHVYRCEPEWRWQVASMPDHDLWCVMNGRGDMTMNGRRHPIRPGSCWLLEPGTSCCASHDPENRLRVFTVHFAPLTPQGQSRGLLACERPSAGVVVHDLALLEALARGCTERYRQNDALGKWQAQLYVRQILLMLLQESPASAGGRVDHRVARVHQAVIEDPGHAWSVPEMATRAGLSRSQFTRRFREATGRSPTQCLLEARTMRACHLLRETALRVGEIADLLGYSDIFYFSRQFKAMVGASPTDYREREQRA